jgi:hypothetical protein
MLGRRALTRTRAPELVKSGQGFQAHLRRSRPIERVREGTAIDDRPRTPHRSTIAAGVLEVKNAP